LKFKLYSLVIIFILIFNSLFILISPLKSSSTNQIINDLSNKFNLIKDLENINMTFFTKNNGQIENEEIRYYLQDGRIWFTNEGVWFELREYNEPSSQLLALRSQGNFDPVSQFHPSKPMKYRRVLLKQEFVGSNDIRPVGREKLNWNCNFFYGNNSSIWCTNVPNYAEIWYENLFDGIDLRYYANKKGIKYKYN